MSTAALPRHTSEALDAIRALSAVLVLIGHTTQPVFSDGSAWAMPAAVAAVGAFFVLSGFLVEHTTATRHHSLQEFLQARFARLYSVLLPALALTYALDAIGIRINPGAYEWFERGHANYLAGLPFHLTFLAQMHGIQGYPGSNTSTWSLCYEALFLVLFAALQFRRSWGAVAATFAIVLVLAGPHVFAFMPLWAAGSALHAWLLGADLRSRLLRLALVMALAIVAAALVFGGIWPLGKLALFPQLLAGAALASILIALAHFCRRPLWRPFANVTAWCARRSYTLFLLHYPMLLLATAALPFLRTSGGWRLVVAAGVAVICYAAAELVERERSWWHRLVTRLVGRIVQLATRPSRRPPRASNVCEPSHFA